MKTTLVVGTVAVVLAFAAGAYVGWKTTMKVMDVVIAKRKQVA